MKDEEKRVILTFLDIIREDVNKAVSKLEKAHRLSPSAWTIGQRKYWKTVRATVNWLECRVHDHKTLPRPTEKPTKGR